MQPSDYVCHIYEAMNACIHIYQFIYIYTNSCLSPPIQSTAVPKPASAQPAVSAPHPGTPGNLPPATTQTYK